MHYPVLHLISVFCFVWTFHPGGFVPQRVTSQKTRCPSPKLQKAILAQVKTAGMPQPLQDFMSASTKPIGKIKERILVSPGVHVFIGHGYANCVVLEAPEGLIVVDTLTDSDLANPVINQIREEISTDPIKALIYTNVRPDHVGGAKAFVDSQPGQKIDVWSHRGLSNVFWDKRTFVNPAINLRRYRENALDFPNGEVYNVSDYEYTGAPKGVLEVPPDKLTGNKRIDVNIAGLVLRMYHLIGPTNSEIGVYFTDYKILIIGDIFNNHFPNIYSMSGEEPNTNILKWIDSLNTILDLDIEILVCAHVKPITVKLEIKERIQKYADALKFLHDQTMRWINRGFYPEEIAQAMKLPKSLSENPDLAEFQGTIEWSVRGIYQSMFGWFNGFPEGLFPLTPAEQAKRWLDLMSTKRLLNSAKQAMKKGTFADLKWAVQATSLLEYVKDDMSEDLLQLFLRTRRQILIKMAVLQTSQIARNYLLRQVLEENCLVHNSSPSFTDTDAILYLPLENLVYKLCALLKPEDVEGVHKNVMLVFTDTNMSYNLRLQNSVLDINRGNIEDFDLRMEMNSTNFRNVLLGKISLEDVGAVVLPNLTLGYEFLGYFDDPSVSYF